MPRPLSKRNRRCGFEGHRTLPECCVFSQPEAASNTEGLSAKPGGHLSFLHMNVTVLAQIPQLEKAKIGGGVTLNF